MKYASGENQTEDSGPNGRNLRPTVDPVGSIRLILSTSAAQRALRAMPQRDRERIIRALDNMKTDPLAGDHRAARRVRRLYRRRVGSWRIIFSLKTDQHVVLVGDIVRRTSRTY